MSAFSYKPTHTLALLALLFLAMLPAAARAQSADSTAAAREHYQKGTAFYDLGRYPDAIREFEAAYELKNDPALLYNLAQSNRLAGNAEQALRLYKTYLRYVPKAPNRAEIEERIATLEQQIAQKGAAQTTPPAGGTTTPPANGTTTAPPTGTGTTAGGAATGTTPPATGTGTTPPGAGVPPTVTTTGAEGLPPPLPPIETGPPGMESGRKLQLIGLGTAGLGGVMFLSGLIAGGAAGAASKEINDAAKANKAFDPAVEARGQRAEAWQKGLMITGVLAGAAGAGLYYYGRRTSERNAAAGTIAFAPVLSAQGGGALLRVSF